jgi:hypothetical protein
MRLSNAHVFECKQCGLAIRIETRMGEARDQVSGAVKPSSRISGSVTLVTA